MPRDSEPTHDSSVDRRSFFRQILLQGLDQAEKSTAQLRARLGQAMNLDQAGSPSVDAVSPAQASANSVARDAKSSNFTVSSRHPGEPDTQDKPPQEALRLLRPPGALPGDQFLDACTRCGDCVKVCPVHAIIMDLSGQPPRADGYPHIVARTQPCVVCDGLACVKACPTPALQKLTDARQVRMGLAIVNHDTCLRQPLRQGGGEDCRLCLSPCPLGEEAIGLGSDGRIQVRAGCVGCGLCEQACPTRLASIWVVATI